MAQPVFRKSRVYDTILTLPYVLSSSYIKDRVVLV